MNWPWRRFEVFFDRHTRRKARAQIEAHRDAVICSINANSNWDGKEAKDLKEERIKGLIDSARAEIELIYASINTRRKAPEPDVFDTDPLFRPLRAGRAIGKPVMNEAGMGAAILG